MRTPRRHKETLGYRVTCDLFHVLNCVAMLNESSGAPQCNVLPTSVQKRCARDQQVSAPCFVIIAPDTNSQRFSVKTFNYTVRETAKPERANQASSLFCGRVTSLADQLLPCSLTTFRKYRKLYRVPFWRIIRGGETESIRCGHFRQFKLQRHHVQVEPFGIQPSIQ